MRTINAIALVGLAALASPSFANVDIAVTPDPLDFGAVEVSTTSPPQNATISSSWDGNGTVNGAANNGSITSISIINPVNGTFDAAQACVGFAVTAATAGATCDVAVTCTPNVVGTISADLQVILTRNNNSTQTQTVSLACVGRAADQPYLTALPNPLDFGNVLVGNSAGPSAVTVTVTNPPVDIGAAAIAGTNAGDFSIGDDNCAGTSVTGPCNIDLIFTPSATGYRSAILTIPCNFDGCPDETVTLEGTGTAAAVAVPALGLVGLGGLSFLLAGSSLVAFRRRRRN